MSKPKDKSKEKGTKQVKNKIAKNNHSQIVGWYGYGAGGQYEGSRVQKDIQKNQQIFYEDANTIYLHNHPRFFLGSLKEQPLATLLEQGLKNVMSAWREDAYHLRKILANNEKQFRDNIIQLGFPSVRNFFEAAKALFMTGKIDITVQQKTIKVTNLDPRIISREAATKMVDTINGGKKTLDELKVAADVLNTFSDCVIALAQNGVADEALQNSYRYAVQAVKTFFDKYKTKGKTGDYGKNEGDFQNQKPSAAVEAKTTGETWAKIVASEDPAADYRVIGQLTHTKMLEGDLGLPSILEPQLANAVYTLIQTAASATGQAAGKVTHVGQQGEYRTASDIVMLNAGVSIKTKGIEQTKKNVIDTFFESDQRLQELNQINNVYNVISGGTVLNRVLRYILYNAIALNCTDAEQYKTVGTILTIASFNEKLFGYNKKDQIHPTKESKNFTLIDLVNEIPPYWMDGDGNCYRMRDILKVVDELLNDNGKLGKKGVIRERQLGSFSVPGLPESQKADLYTSKVEIMQELLGNLSKQDSAKAVGKSTKKSKIPTRIYFYEELKERLSSQLTNVNNMLRGHLSLQVKFDLKWMNEKNMIKSINNLPK